jgi:hypothetical protein
LDAPELLGWANKTTGAETKKKKPIFFNISVI